MLRPFLYIVFSFCCGIVSFSQSTSFISEAEYFWNTDPGEGNGTSITASDGAFDEYIEEIINNVTPPSSDTILLFNIRLKDNNQWGPVYKKVVVKQSTNRNISINSGEYFWGSQDPGLGSGTPIIAFDGAFDEAVETILVNYVNPSLNGVQLFNIRLKDEEGVWGPLFKKTLTFSSQLTSVSIQTAEYFLGITTLVKEADYH